jgi:molybdate transport system substrate-binding protein
MRRTAAVLSVALAVATLAGCSSGSGSSGTTPGAGSTTSGSPSGSITVLAASSLTEAFTTLGKQFETANPGVHVTFSFAASSALAQEVTSGAPADVFASASQKNMQQVVDAGDAASPTTFAKNIMEIAVPPANPGSVTGVASLGGAAVKTALCQPQVPCGSTAQQVFANAKVTVTPVTLEPDVKSVLAKVELGEVDAGVVYVTDVKAAGAKVKGVKIPSDVNASASYPIATLTNSSNATTAAAFLAYVLSPAGQSVLTAAGFAKP